MRRPSLGLGVRIAAAAVATALGAVGILAIGVTVVGGDLFTELMIQHGESADSAGEMFDASVSRIVIVSIGVALVAAIALALFLGGRLAGPLAEIGRAARRIADGDYGARVPRDGPEEVASLADSFNQMAAALEDQERLRRDFIANAAHELRTPLTNLAGYLEGLRDGILPADRPTLESLMEETERLTRLASSLDILAAGDASTAPPELVELDLVAAILGAVELASPGIARADLTLELELPPELPVRASADHLAQILGNLLQNAVRYTPRGGVIRLVAEQRESDVLVTVANSGTAIPADDLPRVFERFYRVEKSRDRARGGAGIGLAIVRQLVETMGGRVGAASDAGSTRFWFSLPA